MSLSKDQARKYYEWAKARGLSDEAIRENLTAYGGVDMGAKPSGSDLTSDVKDAAVMAGKALAYPSNVFRGMLAGGVQEAMNIGNGPDLGVKLKDVFKGEAPNTSEMMKNAGWESNPYYLRSILGGVGDLALDPAVVATGVSKLPGMTANAMGRMGAAAADVANPLGRWIGQGVKNAGKSIYKSGLKRIDQEVAQYGKLPVSDVLMNEGVRGSYQQIMGDMERLAQERLMARNKMLINASAGEVDMNQAMAPALDYAAQLRANGSPEMAGVAEAIEKKARDYIALGGKPETPYIGELPVQSNAPEIQSAMNHNAKLQAQYDLDYSKYMNDMADYENVTGSSSEVFPFAGIDPVRTSPVSVTTEVGGSPRALMTPETASQPFQYELLPMNRKVNVKARNADPAEVSRYNPNTDRRMMSQEPEVTTQMEIGGTDLTPRSYVQAEMPGASVQGAGQIEMPFYPQEPYIPDYLDIPTPTAPQKFYDVAPAVPGPSPAHANKWKMAFEIPETARKNPQTLSAFKRGEERMQTGVRREIENTVSNTTGNGEGVRLRQTNDELGRLLTASERAEMEAAKEANRNAFTSVDGMLAGRALEGVANGASGNFLMPIVKKIADIAKATGPRTRTGYYMNQFGDTPAANALWRNLLLSPTRDDK